MCGYDYVAYRVDWMLGEGNNNVLIGTQSDTLEIGHNIDHGNIPANTLLYVWLVSRSD